MLAHKFTVLTHAELVLMYAARAMRPAWPTGGAPGSARGTELSWTIRRSLTPPPMVMTASRCESLLINLQLTVTDLAGNSSAEAASVLEGVRISKRCLMVSPEEAVSILK